MYLSSNFAYVVLSTDINIAADLLVFAKDQIRKSDVYILQLQYMYKSTRSQLIKKICDLRCVNESEEENIITAVNQLVAQASELFSLSPDFIIKFMTHYLNGGKVSESRGAIFGAIFQSDITRSISDKTNPQNVDIYLSVLDEIAHHMHFSKMAVISSNEIVQIINEYNCSYSENVNPKTFAKAMEDADILVGDEDALNNYRFKDRNVLAYFIARKMNKEIERDTDNLNDLNNVIHNICFGINGTVVLFLSFLRTNAKLIGFFINEAERLLEDAPELNVDGEAALFLRTPFRSEDSRSVEEKRNDIDNSIENSEQIASRAKVKYKDIYEYDETEADNLHYRMVRAFKCLEIASKSLLSLRGNLQAREKDLIIESIYRLPNRFLYKYFSQYEKQFEALEESVNQFIREYTKKDTVSDGTARSIIMQASWSFILGIYDNIAFNCSDSSSIAALDKFRSANTNHRIQNLIMTENAGNTSAFIEKAAKLFESNDDYLQRYLVRRVSDVHIIKHPSIKKTELDRLNSKVLHISNKAILMKKRGRFSQE
jgi:hypothetical protein